MPPPLLYDLDRIDLDRVALTQDGIYELLPQRHEFMLLDGVCMIDDKRPGIVSFADIRPDAWWVKGHVPGRPLLPGVLMLEMAAQSAAVGAKMIGAHKGFMGFGGVSACKFRDTVVPPARLHILVVGEDYRRRRTVSVTQGVVDGRLVFEATITGLTMA